MKHSEVALGNLSLHLYNPRITVSRIAFNHTLHINITSYNSASPYVTIVVQEGEIEKFLQDVNREVYAALGLPLHDPDEVVRSLEEE